MPRGSYRREYAIHLDQLDDRFTIINTKEIYFSCENCKEKTRTSLKNIKRRIKENKHFLCQTCNKLGDLNPCYHINPYDRMSKETIEKLKSSKSFYAKNNKLNEIGTRSISKISSHHKKIISLLEKLNIKQLFETEYIIDHSNYDEGSLKLKKVIEINGDFYHAFPGKYNSSDVIKTKWGTWTAQQLWDRDENKINKAQINGYDTLIIWEHEINTDLSLVESNIKQFIDQH